MERGLAIDPLFLQRAVIDAALVAVPLEMPVRDLFPALAQALGVLAAVQIPLLLLSGFVLVEPALVDAAGRDQQVRVHVALVAVLRRMDRHLHDPALPGELPDMILNEPDVLFERQLVRQGDDDPLGDLRARVLLEPFQAIPELLDVLPAAAPFRRFLRRVEPDEKCCLRAARLRFRTGDTTRCRPWQGNPTRSAKSTCTSGSPR